MARDLGRRGPIAGNREALGAQHIGARSRASLAIAAGASVKAIQRILGHASATLTLDRYGHLFGDELDAVAERLDLHRADFLRTRRGLGEVADLPASRQ